MTIIVTKGTLDWAYPPFILGTTAAAMGVDVTMFFTFYGLSLLLKKLDLQISSLGNPAMKMPMMGMHMAMPNLVVDDARRRCGGQHHDEEPDHEEGRRLDRGAAPAAVEAEVRMIACQMTMDLFEYTLDDMIEGSDPRRRRDLHGGRDSSRTSTCSSDDGAAERLHETKAMDHDRDARRQGTQLPAADPEDQEDAQGRAGRRVARGPATDPGSVADFPAFCRTTGHELLELTQDNNVFRFVIKRLS